MSRIGLQEIRRRAKPGDCPFCGGELKKNKTGRKSKTCGFYECRVTAYQRLYKRDARGLECRA